MFSQKNAFFIDYKKLVDFTVFSKILSNKRKFVTSHLPIERVSNYTLPYPHIKIFLHFSNHCWKNWTVLSNIFFHQQCRNKTLYALKICFQPYEGDITSKWSKKFDGKQKVQQLFLQQSPLLRVFKKDMLDSYIFSLMQAA